jgi:hypothetical protein
MEGTMRIAILAALVLVAQAPVKANADDYPTVGYTYGTLEDSSLEYNCHQTEDSKLECKFVQLTVSRKAKAADVEAKVRDAPKRFPEVAKEIQKDGCESVDILLDALTGDSTPEQLYDRLGKNKSGSLEEFTTAISKVREQSVRDPARILLFKSMGRMCHNPTIENYIASLRAEGDLELKSCRVWSNSFSQTFIWVDSFSSGQGAWVVEGKPEGPCGTLQLSRFEKDRGSGAGSFWNYYARKVATNPSGEFLPDMSCSSTVDQKEYPYLWKKSRDNNLGCQYVDLSPI